MRAKYRFTLPVFLCGLALAAASAPAAAQPVATWNPSRETVVVNGTPYKQFRGILTGSHIGKAMLVSASVAVPYGDLNLTRNPDADEFGRRIQLAAKLVCDQLDRRYPVSLYPILDGSSPEDCVRGTAAEGMVAANQVIAAKRR
jgi:UrcA family protein